MYTVSFIEISFKYPVYSIQDINIYILIHISLFFLYMYMLLQKMHRIYVQIKIYATNEIIHVVTFNTTYLISMEYL